jgi:2-amino-4-hydroxy-6-hydroxymethyldihydropteridine diphosphokinase
MTEAYIGMGANRAMPIVRIERALAMLALLPRTRLTAVSALYRSAPVGDRRQPPFINAVCRLATTLPPGRLLACLLDIERRQGRVRRKDRRFGPRTLDLDLLAYGDVALERLGLRVPHPRLHERRFVLLPLCELTPELEIPGKGIAREWLARLDSAAQPVERLCRPVIPR